MQEIYKFGFFNREKEKEEILQILKSEPRLVNFIYGPINSGKTSLISSITENLSGDFIVFYVNLRGKFISDYRDFVEALFETDIEETHKKALINVFIKEIFKGAGKYSGIPVSENVLNTLFKDDEPKNVFEYITKIAEQAKENKKNQY